VQIIILILFVNQKYSCHFRSLIIIDNIDHYHSILNNVYLCYVIAVGICVCFRCCCQRIFWKIKAAGSGTF